MHPEITLDKHLDSLIGYCLEKWGGRYFQILPCDGHDITNSFWDVLRFYDPDIIYSFTKLDDRLVEKLDQTISPFGLYVKTSNENFRKFDHDSDLENPVSNEFMIGEAKEINRRPFRDEPTQLAVFRMRDDSPEYPFLLRNFGQLSYMVTDNGLRRREQTKGK